MTCTFATFLACFHLSGFYIDGALIHSSAGEDVTRYQETTVLAEHVNKYGDMQLVNIHFMQPVVLNESSNPYVRVALGYDVQWSPKWSTRLDYSHESSIHTGQDHGENRFTLGVTWRPFAR